MNKNIYKRSSLITNKYINKEVNIYNGQKFITLLVEPCMVGYRFGEFAFTRYIGYKNKETSKKK